MIEEGVWALSLCAAFDPKPDVSKSSPHCASHLQSLHSANLPLAPRLYPMRVWPKALFISRKQYSVNVMSPHRGPGQLLALLEEKIILLSSHVPTIPWAGPCYLFEEG